MIKIKRERVPLECLMPDPPLPQAPVAESCDDALIEETDAKVGPWAELMKLYNGLRECVWKHNAQAKEKK